MSPAATVQIAEGWRTRHDHSIATVAGRSLVREPFEVRVPTLSALQAAERGFRNAGRREIAYRGALLRMAREMDGLSLREAIYVCDNVDWLLTQAEALNDAN